MPLGYIPWILYLLPLFLSLSLKKSQVIYLAALATILIIAGIFPHMNGLVTIAIVNRPLGIIVLWLTAVSLRKRIQVDTTLRDERKLLQAIFDNVPVMFTVYDPDIRRVQTNKYLEQVTGWTLEDGERPDFISRVYPDPEYRRMVEEYMKSLSPGFKDLIVTARDGRKIETSWANVRLPDGRQVGIGLDIGERKRVEAEREAAFAALRQSREDMARAQAVGQVGSWRLDVNKNELAWSDETYRIFGESKGTAQVYETFLSKVHPGDRQHVDTKWKAALAGEPYDIDHRIIVDGQIKWVREKAFLEFDKAGKLLGGFGIVQEITERKRAEEVIRRDHEALEQLVRERTAELVASRMEMERAKRLSDIGTLASVVAHELRNPLAAIRLSTYSIRKKTEDPLLRKHTENIENKIAESNQIIDNLLFYSRLRPPHYEKVDILGLIDESIEAVRKLCAKNINIVHSCGLIENVPIDADPTQIKEVFNNILNNACDAVFSGEGKIDVNCSSHDGSMVVRITDNGKGMDQATLEKVREPFFSTKPKGTGLGLTVCQQIIDMHKGQFGIQSEPGKGTEVNIILPKRQK